MSTPAAGGPSGPAWPEQLLDVAEVRGWIASQLAGRATPPNVTGPVEMYQVKGWGVTARFAVASASGRSARDAPESQTADDVVFAPSALPIYAYTPDVYRALMPRVPQHVPALLAWTERAGQLWTLYRRFVGERMSERPTVVALQDVARSTARIQVAVAGLPREEWGRTPHLPVGRLPAVFDEILEDVRERHLDVWKADGGAALVRFGLPDAPLDVLSGYLGDVEAWARELEAGGWPDTVDHDDLQCDNAVRLADGTVLLYDWEGALVSCPSFSLDRLLDDARALDRRNGALPLFPEDEDILAHVADPTHGGSALAGSPSERAVRDAYLDAIPWGTREERGRAFDLGLCLAPIKAAWVSKRHTRALGREEAFSLLTAVCLGRALRRWRSFHRKYAGG